MTQHLRGPGWWPWGPTCAILRRILREEQPELVEISDKWSLPIIGGLLRACWIEGIRRPALVGTSHERLHDNMAVYLKALPQRDAEAPPTSQARLVQPEVMELGRKVYARQCAMCHGNEGKGFPPAYPPLAGNQSITMATPVNPIRMVLNGGYPPGTRKNPRPHGMPPFAHILDDNEVSAVVTYIRVAWDNSGTPVTPTQVNSLRKLLPE